MPRVKSQPKEQSYSSSYFREGLVLGVDPGRDLGYCFLYLYRDTKSDSSPVVVKYLYSATLRRPAKDKYLMCVYSHITQIENDYGTLCSLPGTNGATVPMLCTAVEAGFFGKSGGTTAKINQCIGAVSMLGFKLGVSAPEDRVRLYNPTEVKKTIYKGDAKKFDIFSMLMMEDLSFLGGHSLVVDLKDFQVKAKVNELGPSDYNEVDSVAIALCAAMDCARLIV